MAVVALPVVVRGLGVERFGILALCWIILTYVALVDLGLGRATTKAAAEALARGEPGRYARLARTSVALHGALGVAGALALAALAPHLVGVFRVPAPLAEEAARALTLLAAAVPLALVAAGARSALEAAQRFDLVNAVAVPVNAAIYALSAIGSAMGLTVPGIVLLLVASQGAAALAYLAAARRAMRALGRPARPPGADAGLLLRYARWLAVASVLAPALVYADRFLVAGLLGPAALAYYAAPFDVATRVWVIPGSLLLALLPAFAALGHGSLGETARLYARALRYLFLALAPLALLLVLFAHDLLHLWLGEDFARESSNVLRVLAIGVVASSLAHVPLALLQALGRADVIARLYLAEIVPFLVLASLLVAAFGAVGAAFAWTARVALDAVLLFLAAHRVLRREWRRASPRLARSIVLLVAVAAAAATLLSVTGSPPARALVAVLVLLSSAAIAWHGVMDADDRALVATVLARLALAKRAGSSP